ncbi:MAG: hypothetical protein MI749_07405 [Desulfovibrionales bacterium]|nr:hypothetical protein [Desulfovibrionales bacterium]
MYSSPLPTWTRKAQAFVIRAHRHLWGKNNELPLVFLYENGLTHDFAKKMILGWNKFGQDRPRDGWGLAQSGSEKTFHLPPGLVIPRIDDQNLLGIIILPMEGQGLAYQVPGSLPMEWGSPGGERRYFKDILAALRAVQDNDDIRACYDPDGL